MRHLKSDRLMAAVSSVLVASDSYNDLQVADSRSSNRGSSVELFAGNIAISISADWLEGELDVLVRALGDRPLNLGEVVDLSQTKGLSLSRLGKGVTVDMLSRRLTQVLNAIEQQIPGLLHGDDNAEAMLRALSA
jgi:hypothetical protein